MSAGTTVESKPVQARQWAAGLLLFNAFTSFDPVERWLCMVLLTWWWLSIDVVQGPLAFTLPFIAICIISGFNTPQPFADIGHAAAWLILLSGALALFTPIKHKFLAVVVAFATLVALVVKDEGEYFQKHHKYKAPTFLIRIGNLLETWAANSDS